MEPEKILDANGYIYDIVPFPEYMDLGNYHKIENIRKNKEGIFSEDEAIRIKTDLANLFPDDEFGIREGRVLSSLRPIAPRDFPYKKVAADGRVLVLDDLINDDMIKEGYQLYDAIKKLSPGYLMINLANEKMSNNINKVYFDNLSLKEIGDLDISSLDIPTSYDAFVVRPEAYKKRIEDARTYLYSW